MKHLSKSVRDLSKNSDCWMIWGGFKQELEWCQQVGRIGSPQPFNAWSRFNSKQTPMPLQEIRNELWCPSTQGIMKPITWQPKRKWVITRYSPSLAAWCGGVFNCHHLPGRRRSSYVQNWFRQAAILTGFGVVLIEALNRTWSQVGGLWDQRLPTCTEACIQQQTNKPV